MVSFDLLHVPDCPNLDLARQRVVDAAARAGVEVVIRERLVADPDTAAELGMRGSPTILIDGRDVADAGASTPSMSCRLYRSASGVDGAPSIDDLLAALDR